MMMKIFLLTLVRDAIPDSNSAVVVNTLQKAVEPVEPKGLHDFAAIFLNMVMPPHPPLLINVPNNCSIGGEWLPSGKDGATKSNEFSGKFQTAFDPPPPHFRKIM